MINRNKGLFLEVKNYTNKMLTIGFQCFYIYYENDMPLNQEGMLKKVHLFGGRIPFLEAIFLHQRKIRRGKYSLEFILVIKPMFSPKIDSKIITAYLYDELFFYDKLIIKQQESFSDLNEILKKYDNGINYKTCFFFCYGKYFNQESSDVYDYITGNFDETVVDNVKTSARKEIYIAFRGNFYRDFDHYSLAKLLIWFNKDIKGDKDVNVTEINYIEFIYFIKENFYFYTRLLDFESLFLRFKDRAINTINKKDD